MSSRSIAVVAVLGLVAGRAAAGPASHAAMRPLPVASGRGAASGPIYHVDPKGSVDPKTSEDGDGSAGKPWRTIEAGVKRLRAGDTLYLHGGVYFESAVVAVAGTAKAPITIRSAPGEVAIVDAGVRELEEAPRTAWEPVKGGAPGEFRSVREVAIRKDSDGGRGVWVTGNFADSMVPLHGYRYEVDLRSDEPYWTLTDNVKPGAGIALGPGVWFDGASRRVHVRLAHTQGQPENYAGETDPRKLGLVIGVDRSALRIAKAAHLRIQDVVFRGSATRTVEIAGSSHVELDGVTIYGGSPALWVAATDHLRVVRSALRGTAAPWSSRASMKYRGNSPYLLIADSKGPQSHDWELAYDEFTDGHDGIVIDSVKGLAFHHNRIDNFNDDGIYLSLPPRASLPEDVRIHENVITRVYTVLAFSEADAKPDAAPGATTDAKAIGPGVYVYRNVFDLRPGTYTWIAKDAATAATISPSRICGDHGSPIWEPLMFYQNTVIATGNAFRDGYGAGMAAGTKGTKRRLFNNIFLQIDGKPGLNVPGLNDDIEADGNLLWSVRTGPSIAGDYFAARKGPAGLGAHDVFADPRLTRLDEPIDVRPQPGSAIDAGVKLPPAWPDPLRAADKGLPDIGALPLGAAMLRVGPSAKP